MFNINDLYTTLGTNKVYGCWTNLVTKFDTSSFYNWEQDNLPVLDLDERTSYIWERLGYPTSSITGLAFAVSANAVTSCNSNIFTTLSGCLAAIPDVVNFPVVVEVASFGDLGTLSLSNKVFGPRGSIEIINRNFAKAEPQNTKSGYVTTLSKQLHKSNNSNYLASAVTWTGLDAQINVYQNIKKEFFITSAVSISCPVFSSTSPVDARFAANTMTLFTKKVNPQKLISSKLTASLADTNSVSPLSVADKVVFGPYEENTESWDQISTYDAVPINELTGAEITWRDNDDTAEATVIAYGNTLKGISIYNCNGPIYIRGFTVDGMGYQGKEYGIDIRNSSVNLEDCSVSRCTKAGLYLSNSKVNILRSFITYRNYAFDSNGNRLDTTWLNKINRLKYNTSGSSEKAAGILAVNSEINFSSTYNRDISLYRSSMSTYYPAGYVTNQLSSIPPSYGKLTCFARNDIGILAINSFIRGGKNETIGSAESSIASKECENIVFESNSEAGIRLINSKFDWSGRTVLLANYIGMDSNSSEVSLDTIYAAFNQKEAILLNKSRLNYNKDLYLPATTYATLTSRYHQASFMLNGTHLKLNDSSFEPTYASSMPSIYEKFVASGSFGVIENNTGYKYLLPSIIVDNGSRLKVVSLNIENSESFSDATKSIFGAGISVTNNSDLTLQGTSGYVNKVIGPEGYTYQYNKAGLYADGNSTIRIQGPTVMGKYGVDVLINNNSKLEITPHRDGDGRLLVNEFNLSEPGNHTVVELHSTRSCLVANNNSIITMEDLGDYRVNWGKSAYGIAALASGVDYRTDTDLAYDLYTSGGSIQFYPNPNDSTDYTGGSPPGIANPALEIYSGGDGLTKNVYGFFYFFGEGQYIGNPVNSHQFATITGGGMCLRALNQSKVNVDNVHFPCGFWSPSGNIYESSGVANNCDKLFIWNMADLSQLNAKLISVSGVHPADAAYFGPSGTWGSLSGAPVTTPETSSVSILDFYGKGSGHRYATSSATNQGPFRLYFSVNPEVNWSLSGGVMNGYLRQLYSQGYQPASSITFEPNLSSVYKSILSPIGTSSVAASGFFYASSFMFSPYTVRVLLDESAANSFANAKHNTVGKSGFGKVISVYMPYTGVYGGDSATNTVRDRGDGVKSVNTFDLEKKN